MIYTYKNLEPKIAKTAFIAPQSSVIGNCNIGENSSVWFNTTLRGDSEPICIGKNSNVQDNSVIHTDPGFPAVIEDYVTIGHNVIFHGATASSYSLIGMGSTLLNGAFIGKNSIVGANSLVTEGKKFPEGSLILGSPAKLIRPLTEAELEMIKSSARSYCERAKNYTLYLSRI